MEQQIIFNWIAIVFDVISTVFFAYGVSFQREKALKPAMITALLGLIPHAISIVIRWQITGHGPYMAKYEVLSSNAWVTIFFFVMASWKIPRLRHTGLIVMPLSFLMMGSGLLTDPGIRKLPPTLKSGWLILHVVFAKVSTGAVIIALGTSVLYLLKGKKAENEFYRRLPSLEALDEFSYKFIGFGFIFWSITVAAGAIWANEAWGKYWSWDPIETWSLITWLLYGLYLHLRFFFRWKGSQAAWMLIVCFIFSAVTIFVIPFVIESLHAEYFR
ncbi:MAG: c-type cytochrome biogenesis protein CcsB [Nitrospirae bacterium]|nr:c-type cytochrome biogenesis protein CcsB [Nitrospirota bacterium]